MTHPQMTHHLSNQWREFRLENLFLLCQFFCSFFLIRSGTHGPVRAPKNVEKNSLFFIFVDEFQKIIRCFLFPLIFSTNSTNQRNQRNEFNESTNKIFVDLTKFQRIFNEKFNESTKISTNQRKF